MTHITDACGSDGALQVQHRMRPEISRLIHWRYPKLQDHSSTHGRPHIQGMASDVVFLDHTQLEVPHEDAVAMGNQSKVNMYEVEMAVSLADHLLHQEVRRLIGSFVFEAIYNWEQRRVIPLCDGFVTRRALITNL
jgi:hypothetical protein